MPSIRSLWDRLTRYPGGARLFSFLIGRIAPYTGTVSPRVLELRPGFARVRMRDRRRVRNHLDSVHAIAVLNLAELSSGLALHYGLPPGTRAILTSLSIEYRKKARGTLTAEARAPVPPTAEKREYELESVIRDESGEAVATARARWLVAPLESAGGEPLQ
jgi:acyl-coenzyme A thioesterase PaaI-like protein